jgi:hypothetical protein
MLTAPANNGVTPEQVPFPIDTPALPAKLKG